MPRLTISEAQLKVMQECITDKNRAQMQASSRSQNGIKRINIKPLSVNEGYRGRRFKTKEHKEWEQAVLMMLPKFNLPELPYAIYLKFGVATIASDGDNLIKYFQDALATKYRFNDKKIRRWVIDIDVVGKGKEYIEWDLTTR